MTRLERRNWTTDSIGIKSSGGMLDLFDNAIKSAYRINDEEYDHVCEVATEYELDLLTAEDLTFTEKRNLLIFLKKTVYDKSS